MKKSALLCIFIILMAALPLWAGNLPDSRIEWGEWQIKENRLYQLDTETGLAKVHWEMPQEGRVFYEFDVRYEEGAEEDLHGGFGIQIFVDDPAEGAAWGDGNSYLLWLNYDAQPSNEAISPGLSAQVYHSSQDHRMTLVRNISLKGAEKFLVAANKSAAVPVKLMVDGSTGRAWIYDPFDASLRYPFDLEIDAPLKGSWAALRTNGVSVSFGL